MQVRAIVTADVHAVREGFNVCPEIMIPLVCTNHEIDMITPTIMSAYHTTIEDLDMRENGKVTGETDRLRKCIDLKIGTMLETPRSCIRAQTIAASKYISFASFGTNDLTALVFGKMDVIRILKY